MVIYTCIYSYTHMLILLYDVYIVIYRYTYAYTRRVYIRVLVTSSSSTCSRGAAKGSIALSASCRVCSNLTVIIMTRRVKYISICTRTNQHTCLKHIHYIQHNSSVYRYLCNTTTIPYIHILYILAH